MTIKPLEYLIRIRYHWTTTVAITIVLTILSLFTKQIFFNNDHFSFSWLVPSFNQGISYSISVNMILIIGVSILCLLRLLRSYQKNMINSIIFILIMAGGMSNLIDRMFYGGVRDYVYLGDTLPFLNFVFNIADVMLVLGGILLIYHYHQVDVTSLDNKDVYPR